MNHGLFVSIKHTHLQNTHSYKTQTDILLFYSDLPFLPCSPTPLPRLSLEHNVPVLLCCYDLTSVVMTSKDVVDTLPPYRITAITQHPPVPLPLILPRQTTHTQ